MRMLLSFAAVVLVAMPFDDAPAQLPAAGATFALPNQPGSLKFAVLGGFGTGERTQYELAGQMAGLHERFRYEHVVLTGGNIYGSTRPRDFIQKFEAPYKPLLEAGVTFHASLGRDDARELRYYKLFNMGGKLYYAFSPTPGVRFFALDGGSMDTQQTQWLERELAASREPWKIVFLHDSLHDSEDRSASTAGLRGVVEPLFLKHSVSVVLTGERHVYERLAPQKGTAYFVVGAGGRLQRGNAGRPSGMTAKRFDSDQTFLAAEIIGDEMFFTAISRRGQAVDSGVLKRRN